MIKKRLFQHHADKFKPNVGLKVLEALGSPILLNEQEAQGCLIEQGCEGIPKYL